MDAERREDLRCQQVGKCVSSTKTKALNFGGLKKEFIVTWSDFLLGM